MGEALIPPLGGRGLIGLMTNLERIENYYDHTLSEAERETFEAELKSDPALAEEVAFWVQAHAAAQEEAKARRKAEFVQLGKKVARSNQRAVTYALSLAASVLLAIGFVWYTFWKELPSDNDISQAWATNYIEKNFSQLTTQMSGSSDSLQLGVSSYNSGDLPMAQAIFSQLLERDSLNAEAEKYAGIVSLRRSDYDQAIKHFHRLSTRTDLVSNPGKFYEALALLKRNLPLDNKKAENLLNEVKEGKLEGWKEVVK
jgi:tetratricopeptide (TPR) repeat protein